MKSYGDIAQDGGSNVIGQVREQQDRLRARLSTVRHIVAVASGKGGVGKSFVTTAVASALARGGCRVGILDADLNGPSIPRMAGVRGRSLRATSTGMVPPTNALDVRVVSIDLLLTDEGTPVLWDAPTQRDAYAWRSMMEMGALREFLSDTEWGDLDYLLIDMPPGTDKLSNITDLLPGISGILLVTIPSGVAEQVMTKTIRRAKQLSGIPVLGLVENMASYVCSHCGQEEALFAGGRVERLAQAEGLPYLGGVPFDPKLAAAADAGTLFTDLPDGSPAAVAVTRLAGNIRHVLDGDEA